MKKPPPYTEQQLHRACAGFLAARLAPPNWFTTFPAGGGGKRRGQFLKAMGLKAGVPDLFLVKLVVTGSSRMPFGALYGIELKIPGGSLSSAQLTCHYELNTAGVQTAVVHSLDDLRGVLDAWAFPLRTATKSQEQFQMMVESWQRDLLTSAVSI